MRPNPNASSQIGPDEESTDQPPSGSRTPFQRFANGDSNEIHAAAAQAELNLHDAHPPMRDPATHAWNQSPTPDCILATLSRGDDQQDEGDLGGPTQLKAFRKYVHAVKQVAEGNHGDGNELRLADLVVERA